MAEQTQIEIKPPQPAHHSDAGDDQVLEQQVRFFKSGTRKREDSWVISLFVVLHIVAFAATMFVNDCWQNSHRDCAIKVLGRLSFQPLWENPLLGPSSSTWVLFPFFLSWEFSLLIPIAVWLLRKSDKRKNECWRRGGGFLFFFYLILQCFWVIGNVILEIIVLFVLSRWFLRRFERENERFWFSDLDFLFPNWPVDS